MGTLFQLNYTTLLSTLKKKLKIIVACEKKKRYNLTGVFVIRAYLKLRQIFSTIISSTRSAMIEAKNLDNVDLKKKTFINNSKMARVQRVPVWVSRMGHQKFSFFSVIFCLPFYCGFLLSS